MLFHKEESTKAAPKEQEFFLHFYKKKVYSKGIYLLYVSSPTRMGKKQKNNRIFQNTTKNNFSEEKKELEVNIEQKIKDVLSTLNKKDKKELDKAVGTGDFIEQLRKFFQTRHPNLLDEIESKDKLKIYIDQLKDQGFTIEELVDNHISLEESFKETDSEFDVCKKSIKKLKDYCEKEQLPSDFFDKFADFAQIEKTPDINKTSKIRKTSDLLPLRNKFIESNKGVIGESDTKNIEKIMSPRYAPTTRLLVSAAIKKIRKDLPANLRKDFDARFPLPITITSDIQSITEFKNEWLIFLQANQNLIDKDLAKKLDSIKIFNQDMYEEFEDEGIAFDKTRGFTEQEQTFRLIFNKLATRQLFDDVNKRNTIADMQIKNIAEIFYGFPPYLNDTFDKYPYDEAEIKKADHTFTADIDKYNTQIATLNDELQKMEEQGIADTDEQKKACVEKIKAAKQERDTRKRQGYATYLAQQNAELGAAMQELISSKFDVAKLSKHHQQAILDVLVKDKLEKIIREGTAEALGIDETRFLELMREFFDLEKKEITIPSPAGDIVFDCPEKSFLGGPLLHALEIGSRGPILTEDEKKNLPLNMKLLLTEDNKDYFEKSPIFSNIFSTFNANNGTQTLHEGYKVQVSNSQGNSVDGYLSTYPPKGIDDTQTTYKHKTRYLYSHPITRPEDDRELVFWDKNKPVEIDENEESSYAIKIKERELNLNGKAIGAMLFGTTVGQYAQENSLNAKDSQKLEEAFTKLESKDLYKDTNEYKEEEERSAPKEEEEKPEEKNNLDKFLDAWKELGGYQTLGESKNGERNMLGFEKGARMMIPMLSSVLPPNKDSEAYLNLEITDINTTNNTFKVKVLGGENKIGAFENYIKTIPLSPEGIKGLKKSF